MLVVLLHPVEVHVLVVRAVVVGLPQRGVVDRPVRRRDLVVQRAVVAAAASRRRGTGRAAAPGAPRPRRRRTPGAAGRRTPRGSRRPGRCPRARGAPAWRGRRPSGRGSCPAACAARRRHAGPAAASARSQVSFWTCPWSLSDRAAAALATLRAAWSLPEGFAAGAAPAAVARPPASSVAAAARTRAWRRRRWMRFTWVPCLPGRSDGSRRVGPDWTAGRLIPSSEPGGPAFPPSGILRPEDRTLVYPTGRSGRSSLSIRDLFATQADRLDAIMPP